MCFLKRGAKVQILLQTKLLFLKNYLKYKQNFSLF